MKYYLYFKNRSISIRYSSSYKIKVYPVEHNPLSRTRILILKAKIGLIRNRSVKV